VIRTLRWLVVGVLAASTTVGLAACSPKAPQVTALRAVDGQPVLLIAACDGFDVARISVFPEETSSAEKWTVNRGTGAAPDEVPLLHAPQGWTAESGTLPALRPRTEYSVAAYGEQARPAVPIRFTVEQVAGLGAGEVLIGRPSGGGKAVSESKFRSGACS
jgi:hypothetical protein